MPTHIYRTNFFWTAFTALGGAAMTAGGVFCLVRTFLAHDPRYWGNLPLWSGYLIGVSLSAIGAWAVLGIVRWRVVLSPDTVEVAYPFSTLRLKRSDIVAKQLMPGVNPPTYAFYTRDSRQRSLKIGMQFPMDKMFRDWMESVPDADKAFFQERRARKP